MLTSACLYAHMHIDRMLSLTHTPYMRTYICMHLHTHTSTHHCMWYCMHAIMSNSLSVHLSVLHTIQRETASTSTHSLLVLLSSSLCCSLWVGWWPDSCTQSGRQGQPLLCQVRPHRGCTVCADVLCPDCEVGIATMYNSDLSENIFHKNFPHFPHML